MIESSMVGNAQACILDTLGSDEGFRMRKNLVHRNVVVFC